jgi:N-acetylglucosaminyldiphosphoundecaprenol N-acetyl-beta-D-mannosaminyltransferase
MRPVAERARRVTLLGTPLDPLTEAEAVDAIFAALEQGRGGWVLTPNLDHLNQFARSGDLRRFHDQADLVLADGMPLVWASRLRGTPLPERVAGSNLIWSVSGRAAQDGRSVYLLGGTPGVGEVAAKVLREHYPALSIVGAHAPPFGFEREPAELDQIETLLKDARPDIVLVCLPFPKQEVLIEQLQHLRGEMWFLGLGVSLSFVAGDLQRAPDWMRAMSLEWIHRLIQEPRRLYRRYLVEGVPFAARLFARALVDRVRYQDK